MFEYLIGYAPIFLFGLLISTTAMATGIEGAIFWGPLLLFVYGLPPEVAIACGIFIEVFGFGSGTWYYYRRGKLLFKQVNRLVVIGTLFGLAGVVASKYFPDKVLYGLMGTGTLFLVANRLYSLLHGFKETKVDGVHHQLIKKNLGYGLNAVGGFFTGAIGVGLGELNNYYFFMQNRLPVPYSTGNGVYIIAIVSFICSILNTTYYSFSMPLNDLKELGAILVFALPSVVVGARVGGYLAHLTSPRIFNIVVIVIFLLISGLTYYRMFQ